MSILIKFPEVIRVSHSRIKTWRRCQKAHHYKYYEGLRRVTKKRPLYLGSSVHSLIEGFIERGNWDAEMAYLRKEYNKLFLEEKAELGNIPLQAEQIVKGYFQYYREDGFKYPKRMRGRRTELPLNFYITDQIQFIGFIDAYPIDGQGLSWLEDHKTCKRIPDEETRYNDLQLLLYYWALPRIGQPKPDGVLWDYLRTKEPTVPEKLKSGGISKSAKIDTTYDVYMDTVEQNLGAEALPDYEEFAETLRGNEQRFYRRIHLPNPPDIMVDTVVEDVIKSAREILDYGRDATVRSMSRECKMCDFYNLCHSEIRGLDTEFILKTEYVKEQRHGNTTETDDDENSGEGDED